MPRNSSARKAASGTRSDRIRWSRRDQAAGFRRFMDTMTKTIAADEGARVHDLSNRAQFCWRMSSPLSRLGLRGGGAALKTDCASTVPSHLQYSRAGRRAGTRGYIAIKY